jgi:hypothetical protein
MPGASTAAARKRHDDDADETSLEMLLSCL